MMVFKRYKLEFLLGLLILFNIADAVLTHFLVSGGIASEGNPFLLPIVGESGFIIIKVAGVLLCSFILWDISRRYPKLALVSTSVFTAAYGLIVAWNLSLLVMGS